MTRAVLAACVVAGCYTSPNGENNLCVPGHDGLCPHPALYHTYGTIGLVTAAEPSVIVRSTDDLATTLEEIAIDAEASSELPFADTIFEAHVSLACATSCVAAWQNLEGFVTTAVRDEAGWSAPLVHDSRGHMPAVAIAGNVVLVAWPYTIGRDTQLELRRLDPSGNLIEAATVALGIDRTAVSLTAGPAGFLLVWERMISTIVPPQRWLVAQAISPAGTLVDTPFEMQIADGYEVIRFAPWPSAFFDGAYRVVHHGLPGDAAWSVIDPTARTIQFAGPIGRWNDIASMTPLATGALVGLNRPASGLARVENDTWNDTIALAGPPHLAQTADGFQLAYNDDGSIVVERRDPALEVTEPPRVIAEKYELDTTTCATAGSDSAGLIVIVVAFACRRRRASR